MIIAGALLLFALMSLLFYLFPVIKICGTSMYPTLKDGEFYLSKRVFNKNKLTVGGIYVFIPPYSNGQERYVIKRLHRVYKNRCFFLGDNSKDSYDSRDYGYVASSKVVAQLIVRK